jgi:hypothetical protein
MAKEVFCWLRYDGRVFPGAPWRDHLRACGVRWDRTRATDDLGVCRAIAGKGYVVWVSDARWTGESWWIGLAVVASAPPAGAAAVQAIVRSALARFPGMTIEEL